MRLGCVAALLWTFLLFPLCAGAEEKKGDEGEKKNRSGTVTGRIACGESCPGVASLWDAAGPPPDPRRYIVIPLSFSPLQPDGSFRLSAPPGRYYVGAVVRSNPASNVGPPRAGDRVFISPDAAGKSQIVEIREGKNLDLGLQDGGWTYEGFTGSPGPAIAGKIATRDGKPVPNLLVFAFDDPELSGTPVAVSERTQRNGEFLLRLPRPGTVYLRLMENYGGGRPAQGGYMGIYGDGAPRALKVEGEETVRGITIEALRVPAMRNPEKNRMRPPGR